MLSLLTIGKLNLLCRFGLGTAFAADTSSSQYIHGGTADLLQLEEKSLDGQLMLRAKMIYVWKSKGNKAFSHGKGHLYSMRKLQISIGTFKGHQGNDQGLRKATDSWVSGLFMKMNPAVQKLVYAIKKTLSGGIFSFPTLFQLKISQTIKFHR